VVKYTLAKPAATSKLKLLSTTYPRLENQQLAAATLHGRKFRDLTLREQMSKLVYRPDHHTSKDQNIYPNKQTTLMNTEFSLPGSTSPLTIFTHPPPLNNNSMPSSFSRRGFFHHLFSQPQGYSSNVY
jgi:hypothetical protein